jgi:flagellar hook-basal body complex protein FliE
MNISAINSTFLNDLNTDSINEKKDTGFDNVLKDLIGNVNQSQLDSNQLTNEFISGGNVEIHEVMIAGEKAKTSLDLLVEIRNKAVDMYKELTRIQV